MLAVRREYSAYGNISGYGWTSSIFLTTSPFINTFRAVLGLKLLSRTHCLINTNSVVAKGVFNDFLLILRVFYCYSSIAEATGRLYEHSFSTYTIYFSGHFFHLL